MKSLRAHIAVILVSSIICVVGAATAAAFLLIRSVGHGRTGEIIANQVMSAAPLLRTAEPSLKPYLKPEPMPGKRNGSFDGEIEAALRRAGSDLEVVVTQPPAAADLIAWIKFEDGWLPLPVQEPRPPPEAWFALAGWMCLIAIGTGAVALGFAHRITRHLAMLESVALMVDSNDSVPRLPETGPAEVKATARALNTMATRLNAAIESRMRLVAAAGHDLRTPLTRMRLRAEFFEEEERSHWVRDLEELGRIADSAIQLVREQVDREKSHLLRVDTMISEICRELASIDLAVSVANLRPVTILSSPLGLTRALRNLIINAATHGGSARVSVGVLGEAAVIAIEDDGPGIPEDMMSRVFEPFFRVDPSRRQTVPGAGLGLAIAKEIVERHGGKLTLENRSPQGLRQEVTFAAVAT